MNELTVYKKTLQYVNEYMIEIGMKKTHLFMPNFTIRTQNHEVMRASITSFAHQD